MSLYTLAGLVFGLALFLVAIVLSTDNYLMFLSVESFIMVLGGTLANAFISYQGRYVVKALKDVARVFSHARINEDILLNESRRVINWATIVSTEGILALEQKLKTKEAHDHFLQYGIKLVVDGRKPHEVRELMTNTLSSKFQRATTQVVILRNMAASAPAFGMVGTLVGLIIMLDGLGDDAGGLGAGLAIALLTTLYGVMFARFIFQPAADKTLQREEIERFRNQLMLEGFVMLAEERRPGFVEARINSFLAPEDVAKLPKRKRVGGDGGGSK